MRDTIISWTNHTWNPVHGCSKISEGCRHCYAEAISLRMRQTTKDWTHANAAENITLKPHKLNEPYALKSPSMVFVNSMSDLFHELIPDDYRRQIFDVMADLPQHAFQVLTKRPALAIDWAIWPPNVWMGVSVEDRRSVERIDLLRLIPAALRFISFEPLLEGLGELDLTGIAWAIVGGESGPSHRKMEMAWARSIRDQCVDQQVAFFFKQDSGWRTELRPYIVEPDGSHTVRQQYPATDLPGQESLGHQLSLL